MMRMRPDSLLLQMVSALCLCAVCTISVGKEKSDQGTHRPNILLIVVDDMGFADLGSFGSEIPTPHLDALALEGIRFTNFITSSVCSPTRASLLTGVTPHKAGFGNLKEELAPNQKGQPGYEGYLNQRVVTTASLLSDAGYRTYMTGKWHLGNSLESSPWARGFERSFAMLANASHFADMRPAYSPDPDAKALYREDRNMLQALPDNFDYSSQFYVDRLIEYIDSAGDDRPFFGLLAFAAPHWPLQAPDHAIAAFRGRYDIGYDLIADRRLQKQKELGIADRTTRLAPRPPQGAPWSALSDEQQRTSARAMEVYAAMIAEIDRHTGRLLNYLRQSQQFDNTVILFISDNGAEGHDLDETWPADVFPEIRKVIDERHDFSYENMGRPGSYTFYGPNWAQASAPAFHLHKGFASEGGIRTAGFIYSAGEFNDGLISDELITATDLAATVLELAGVTHPGSRFRDRSVEPMTGRSILGRLNTTANESGRVHVNETMGKIAVRRGRWKITRMPPPFGNARWQLFDLRSDLGESVDLAARHPDIVKELVAEWQRYANKNGVILPDWVSGY